MGGGLETLAIQILFFFSVAKMGLWDGVWEAISEQALPKQAESP